MTIPDNTNLVANQSFNKTWRMRNNGTCAWDTGFQLIYYGGEAMTTSPAVAVPATAPGATVDITVPMSAPATPGAHAGTWRIRNAAGALIGQAITVKIVVVAAASSSSSTAASSSASSSTSSAAGCSGTPVIPSFAASPASIAPGGSSTLSWSAVTNADSVEIDQGIGGVATPGNANVSPGSTTTYTMTARCGANSVTRTATVTVAAPVGNFNGQWIHNFGTMTITQNGSSVTGTYLNSFDNGPGTVAGNVTGNTLTGTYQKSGSGPIQFTLSADGNSFDGSWGGTNKWCGARAGKPFPAGCSFSGNWSTKLDGYPTCSMSLTRTDNSVTGTYCNGTVDGTITYTSDAAKLAGNWRVGMVNGNLTFYLLGYNGNQFQGNYDGISHFWCGWRGGATEPAPCAR